MTLPTSAHRVSTRCLAAGLTTVFATCVYAPFASAQELTPAPEPTANVRGHYEGDDFIPEVRVSAPDTESCPQATWPAEPVTTSEAVSAGSAPTPLAVTYTGPCGVSAPAGFAVSEDVVASSWLVADIDTGDIVAMKDPHGRYRPASIIKVLLALVAIRDLPLDKEIVVSHDSAAQEGSAVGIVEGGRYTVNDLLHGLLLASGNDAAHALAQELGGDVAALNAVNELAANLGMTDTRVATYSGLDAPGMSSSAFDLALAYRAAFANPDFARIADTDFYPFPAQEEAEGFEVWNDNHLYLNDPDGIGGKTGYTDDANHTFAGAVNHEGRRLLAVILDTASTRARPWEQAQHLLHEAYRFEPTQAVASLNAPTADMGSARPADTETATPQAPTAPADQAAGSAATMWRSIAIVGGVAVLALAALVLSLLSRGSTTPGRRRR